MLLHTYLTLYKGPTFRDICHTIEFSGVVVLR